MDAQQRMLPLFDANIRVRKERGIYIAELFGGWWLGVGSTPEKAIKQVIANYQKESDYYL